MISFISFIFFYHTYNFLKLSFTQYDTTFSFYTFLDIHHLHLVQNEYCSYCLLIQPRFSNFMLYTYHMIRLSIEI